MKETTVGLKIAGVWNPICKIETGKTTVFPGAGFIRATAIERTSKNRYTAFVIADSFAYAYPMESLSSVVKLLQAEYDENGSLLSKGRGEQSAMGRGETSSNIWQDAR